MYLSGIMYLLGIMYLSGKSNCKYTETLSAELDML